jgi:hypothetical protein
VKIFREESTADCLRELCALQLLGKKKHADLRGRVIGLAENHLDAPPSVLYLLPVGVRLALSVEDCSPAGTPPAVRVTPAMLAFAVSTLRLLHTAGLVHRDVRPHNMFVDPASKQARLAL